MKYGCINAPCLDPNKKSLFWLQTRSSWESALKAHAIELINSTSGKDWLETCGSHSAVNCLTAVNPDPSTLESHGPGGDTPRVPDVLTDYFNRPSNQSKFSVIVPGVDFDRVFENEFAQLYPLAVKEVFGVDCSYQENHSWDELVTLVKAGKAIQIVFIHPGHFVAVVGYDDFTKTLSYIDPNDRTHPDGNWFDCPLDQKTHDENVKDHIIVFG